MQSHSRDKRHCSRVWGFAALPAIIALLLFFGYGNFQYIPPCRLHLLAGLYCPACGSLRALHLLVNGQFMDAFRMNPLLIISLPFIGFLVFFRPRGIYLQWFIWGGLILLFAFGIARNIPLWPFELLAPV